MDVTPDQRLQAYLHARRQHPAWQLLAARRGPLIVACLQSLLERSEGREGIDFGDAIQALAELLQQRLNDSELGPDGEDPVVIARRELRDWIKRGLVVERENRLYATDALETALRFVDGLRGRIMTSTASRLSVVQREIERLESSLNPDPIQRAERIRRSIAELQQELAAVEAGDVPVLDPSSAVEGIREVYALATSLRVDFRRVEDSWREADRVLRHAIVNEQHHRGSIVDSLLDGHETLLQTPEGRVFQGFQQQLGETGELDDMKTRLRSIMKHPSADAALTRQQQLELRWLVMRLVKESSVVIRARARSERDVRSFLRTGLAAEHHRVGLLLNTLLQHAQAIDWQSQRVRRSPAPLPPVGFPVAGLPTIERLRVKSLDQEARRELALQRQRADLDDVGDEFWAAFDGLDRDALMRDTLALIAAHDGPISLGGLAAARPPTHDLVAIALWLGMAREADLPVGPESETLDVIDREGMPWQFTVPRVALSAADFVGFSWEP